MKKLKNIFNKLKKVSRLKKTWVLLALTIAIAIPSATLATWGPARPTFDYNDPTGRLGSLTGPVFNSILQPTVMNSTLLLLKKQVMPLGVTISQ